MTDFIRGEREPSRRRALVALRLIFGTLGLAFLGIAFAATFDDARGSVAPSPWRLVGAQLLALATLVLAGRGWAALLGGDAPARALSRSFYDAQLAKYIPGGVWQVAGQVGLASHAGVPIRRASAAFAVHALVFVVAGGTIGATLAVSEAGLPPEVRVASLLGLLALLLLHRSWMVAVLRLVARATRRRLDDDVLPPQRAIIRCYVWTLPAFGCTAAAFAVLASRAVDASPFTTVGAFALAWTLGFLAVPFPSGLGVREAVLIGALAATSSPAPVIAASVVHRLVTMAAEVTMIVASRLRRGGGPRPRREAVATEHRRVA